jgi:dolichol-phosphate mannosyltransferase
VVTPAYNEAENLEALYRRLCAVFKKFDADWEWVVIDDHSSDKTFEVLTDLSRHDRRVRALRFARNSGSHLASVCGLQEAAGECAVIMAADLQDPPETLPELIERWRAGAQVVWAVRARRLGESASTIVFSRLYYWLMRTFVGLKQMPPSGVDFFLLDRQVLDGLRDFQESNVSLISLILWMGFRQESVVYEKQKRLHGSSKWNLESKLKLLVDSITAFSFKPIRYISYAGFVFAALGFLYAIRLIANAVNGHPVEGWTSLMVVVLVLGGFQMLMMGILGEYLWRTLDEARRRPRFLIEAAVGQPRPAHRLEPEQAEAQQIL